MKKCFLVWVRVNIVFFTMLGILTAAIPASADPASEQIYNELCRISKGDGDISVFSKINIKSRRLDWTNARETTFAGNMRRIQKNGTTAIDNDSCLFLLRTVDGILYIVSTPENPAMLEKGADSFYADIKSMLTAKMNFTVKIATASIEGREYNFARLSAVPKVSVIDKVFRIAIIVVLFAVMLGMGLSLTPKDFASVLKNPMGIIVGLLCLYGVMPLIASGMGRFMGYDTTFPFVFVGLILVTATPGGATSNLMTHLAKGDVALSISMTALASVSSLVVTPALLLFYCSNIPQVDMPVKMVMLQILVLVLIPLLTGMAVKAKFAALAEKAMPVFNIIGVIAIIICLAGGIAGNPEMFKDAADKFGAEGFIMIFALVIISMLVGGILPKLVRLNNYQARAISMEIGIRNVILGMTIALLIQDRMGDFNSYMFAISGLFAIAMYIIGGIAVVMQKKLLPVKAR